MNNIAVLEAANYMHDSIALTYIPKELVSESLPLTCPFNQSGNIDEFNSCRSNLL